MNHVLSAAFLCLNFQPNCENAFNERSSIILNDPCKTSSVLNGFCLYYSNTSMDAILLVVFHSCQYVS